MKVHKVLFSILALALCNGVESQRHGRFIVDLITHTNPTLILCVGTVITESHVLVPATCVTGVERLGIGIRGPGSQILFGNRIYS